MSLILNLITAHIGPMEFSVKLHTINQDSPLYILRGIGLFFPNIFIVFLSVKLYYS